MQDTVCQEVSQDGINQGHNSENEHRALGSIKTKQSEHHMVSR
jgi:hypothetical protein